MSNLRLRQALGLGLALCVSGLLGGCPNATRNDFPTEFDNVNRIASDTTLSPQRKRELLRNEGLSESAINAFLRDEEQGNQFGGDLRSAADKIAAGDFTALTPDEIQIYGAEAADIDTSINGNLSDENAQAIADLFSDEDIDDAIELEAFLDEPGSDSNIPDTIPSGVLRDLFVDFDVMQVFNSLP